MTSYNNIIAISILQPRQSHTNNSIRLHPHKSTALHRIQFTFNNIFGKSWFRCAIVCVHIKIYVRCCFSCANLAGGWHALAAVAILVCRLMCSFWFVKWCESCPKPKLWQNNVNLTIFSHWISFHFCTKNPQKNIHKHMHIFRLKRNVSLLQCHFSFTAENEHFHLFGYVLFFFRAKAHPFNIV